MTKVINPNLKHDVEKLVDSKEVRSMAKYIRSHGEYRSGLTTTTDGGALVPSELVNTAEDLSAGAFQLKPYVNTVKVHSAKGDYPVMNPTAVATTKEELAKYPDLDDGIKEIPYNVKSYAARVVLSNELLEDSSLALTPVLAKELATVMVNTQNKMIADKMATLPATKVSSVDDVVSAIFAGVDPRFLKVILVGQAAMAQLKTAKDNQGRYILKTDDNTIGGVPVVVMPNLVGDPNSIYVGDPSVALTYFDRGNVNVNYASNNIFAKSLAFVMRGDVAISYAPALKHLTLNAAK